MFKERPKIISKYVFGNNLIFKHWFKFNSFIFDNTTKTQNKIYTKTTQMKIHKMHKIQTIEKNKMAYKMKLKYFNIFNKHTNLFVYKMYNK